MAYNRITRSFKDCLKAKQLFLAIGRKRLPSEFMESRVFGFLAKTREFIYISAFGMDCSQLRQISLLRIANREAFRLPL